MAKQPTGNRRVAFTLPSAFLADLSYVSLRLGIPKSDIVAGFLAEPLSAMRSVLFQFPDPLDRLGDDERAALFAQFSGLVGAAVQDGQEVHEELQRVGEAARA